MTTMHCLAAVLLIAVTCFAVDFEVVLPEHPAAYELKAKEELLGHLSKMPLESMTVGGEKPIFHIGATDAAKAVGFGGLSQEEYVVCSDGGRLILAGGGFAFYWFKLRNKGGKPKTTDTDNSYPEFDEPGESNEESEE